MGSIIAIASVALALIGALVFVVEKLDKARDKSESAIRENAMLTVQIGTLREDRAKLLISDAEKTTEIKAANDARKLADARYSGLVKSVAQSGDPKALAATIHDELEKLEGLS